MKREDQERQQRQRADEDDLVRKWAKGERKRELGSGGTVKLLSTWGLCGVGLSLLMLVSRFLGDQRCFSFGSSYLNFCGTTLLAVAALLMTAGLALLYVATRERERLQRLTDGVAPDDNDPADDP